MCSIKLYWFSGLSRVINVSLLKHVVWSLELLVFERFLLILMRFMFFLLHRWRFGGTQVHEGEPRRHQVSPWFNCQYDSSGMRRVSRYFRKKVAAWKLNECFFFRFGCWIKWLPTLEIFACVSVSGSIKSDKPAVRAEQGNRTRNYKFSKLP